MLIAAVSVQQDAHGAGDVPWRPLAAILAVAVVLWSMRTTYKLYAEQREAREGLELRLVPRLKPGPPQIKYTHRRVGDSEVRANYVQLPLHNIGGRTVMRCVAHLSRIELRFAKGFRELAYNDNLALAWASNPSPALHADIHPDATEVLDVVYAIEGSAELHLATRVELTTYADLMAAAGQYRFTFQVSSEGSRPRTMQLRVYWGLAIDTLALPADPLTVLRGAFRKG